MSPNLIQKIIIQKPYTKDNYTKMVKMNPQEDQKLAKSPKLWFTSNVPSGFTSRSLMRNIKK